MQNNFLLFCDYQQAFSCSIVPSAPTVTVVGGDGAVVIWNTPEMPNGIIVSYELRFTGQETSSTILTEPTILYYVPSFMDFPHTTDETVKVEFSTYTCFIRD